MHEDGTAVRCRQVVLVVRNSETFAHLLVPGDYNRHPHGKLIRVLHISMCMIAHCKCKFCIRRLG
jgi:hypothetical protein